jgi:hypothetical protein
MHPGFDSKPATFGSKGNDNKRQQANNEKEQRFCA